MDDTREIDARSIVTLIVFIIVSKSNSSPWRPFPISRVLPFRLAVRISTHHRRLGDIPFTDSYPGTESPLQSIRFFSPSIERVAMDR